MNTPIERYGIREQRKAEAPVDVHVEEIGIQGFTYVDGGFSATEIQDLKSRLDRMMSIQAAEAGGEEVLKQISESNTVRALLAYDDIFLDIVRTPTILEICKRLLGDYFILMLQNATINPPSREGHHQSAYHRDLPYQHFVSSRPLAINALLCLDPFSAETGSTFILPGSHKIEAFPSDGYVRKMEIPTVAPAGTFIVFDSMMYHCAGINTSPNARYAVNTCYTLPILKQQISLPALLNGKWSEDEELAKLLGYRSEPPRSVRAWRQSRNSKY